MKKLILVALLLVGCGEDALERHEKESAKRKAEVLRRETQHRFCVRLDTLENEFRKSKLSECEKRRNIILKDPMVQKLKDKFGPEIVIDRQIFAECVYSWTQYGEYERCMEALK